MSKQFWVPVLNKKQFEIFNCYKRFLLVSGPRKSSKTIGVCHKLVRHAFDTDKARASIFTKTIKVALDGGCWSDLTTTVIPEWIEADIGLDWVTRPKVDGSTRQHYCEITNRHKSVSRIILNSLEHDQHVGELTKGKRFSFVWFNELSNFKSRKVFDTTIQNLRAMHLGFSAHQWIADTNPSDEGEESWIYKLWYKDRVAEDFPVDVVTDDDIKAFREFQERLGLIEVMIPDNTFLSEEDKRDIVSTYRHDKDLYDRYVLGKWTTTTENSHFADVFRNEIHVIGNTDDLNPDNWETMLPQDNCKLMITGWDIGSVNHSVHILEPANVAGVDVFKVMDELVVIKQNISLSDIVEEVLERMNKMELLAGQALEWRHWSDKSAFDHFRPAVETYDYNVVFNASGGKIDLKAAPKYKDSIKHRINLARRLLFEDRLLVSANCPSTIAMFRGLKKGASALDFIDRTSRHKHAFDSLTYAIAAEIPAEMGDHDIKVGRKPKLIMMG